MISNIHTKNKSKQFINTFKKDIQKKFRKIFLDSTRELLDPKVKFVRWSPYCRLEALKLHKEMRSSTEQHYIQKAPKRPTKKVKKNTKKSFLVQRIGIYIVEKTRLQHPYLFSFRIGSLQQTSFYKDLFCFGIPLSPLLPLDY